MKKKWIRQALTLLLISILVFEPVPSSALRISPVLSAAAEEKDEDSEAEKEAKKKEKEKEEKEARKKAEEEAKKKAEEEARKKAEEEAKKKAEEEAEKKAEEEAKKKAEEEAKKKAEEEAKKKAEEEEARKKAEEEEARKKAEEEEARKKAEEEEARKKAEEEEARKKAEEEKRQEEERRKQEEAKEEDSSGSDSHAEKEAQAEEHEEGSEEKNNEDHSEEKNSDERGEEEKSDNKDQDENGAGRQESEDGEAGNETDTDSGDQDSQSEDENNQADSRDAGEQMEDASENGTGNSVNEAGNVDETDQDESGKDETGNAGTSSDADSVETGKTETGADTDDSEETEHSASDATESPAAGTTENPAAGAVDDADSGATENPAAGTTENPAAGTTENPAAGTTENPAAGTTENPAAGTTGNPAAGTTENPAAGTTENPAASATELPAEAATMGVTEEAVKMPAKTFRGSANGVSVTVKADEGTFPEGTEMKVRGLSSSSVKGAVENAIGEPVDKVKAVDISFWYKGKEIQPEKSVEVSLKASDMDGYPEYKAVHISGGSGDVVDDMSRPSAHFDFGHFTPFALAAPRAVSSYEVNFYYINESGEKTFVESRTIEEGQALGDLPDGPARSDAEFTGWVCDGNEVTAETLVTGEMEIMASYTEFASVVFMVDGETYKTYQVEPGEALGSLPQAPFKEGSTFEKWVDASDETVEVTAATVVPEDGLTAIAVFNEINIYDVTVKYFYVIDGNRYDFSSEVYEIQEEDVPYTITVPSSTQVDPEHHPDEPTYYPSEPSIQVTTSDLEAAGEDKQIEKEVEYVEYTAEYDFVYYLKDLDGQGYTELEREHVRGVMGSTVTATVKEFPNADFERTESVTISQREGQEVPVYYNRAQVTLSYETGGGSYIAPQHAAYGSTAAVTSERPTLAGYTFDGWYLDQAYTQQAGTSITMEGDVVLYAKWRGQQVPYTIVYMKEKYENGSTSYVYDNSRTAQAEVGTTVVATNAPDLTNNINGYEKDTARNAASTAVIKADGTSVLTVYYKLIRYTLVFNINRNSGRITMGGQTYTGSDYRIENVVLGEDVSSRWPSSSNEIYDTANGNSRRYFRYWSGASNNYVTKRYELVWENVQRANSNHVMTFTAEWVRDNNNRSAEYWLQQPDGSYQIEDSYTQTGLNTTSLTQKDIDGYTKHNGTPRGYQGNETDFWGNVTRWRFYYDRAQYIIDYYYGSTKLTTRSNIYFEADISDSTYNYTPAKPAGKEDYTWGGWYSDSGLTNKYTFDKMPGHNLALYARWIAPQYTVTYDTQGGTPDFDEETVDKGNRVDFPGSPTKQYHHFDGWWTAAEGGEQYDWAKPVTEDITLYAHWTPDTIQYTVHYYKAGTTESVFADKIVKDPSLAEGQVITEEAVTLAGNMPDAPSKTLTLGLDSAENVIIFYYSKREGTLTYTVNYVIQGHEDIKVHKSKTVTVDASHISAVETAAGVNKSYIATQTEDEEILNADYYPLEDVLERTLSSNPDENVITFHYTNYKTAKITVNYLDMDGNPIPGKETTVEHPEVGARWTIPSSAVSGYRYHNHAIDGSATSSKSITVGEEPIVVDIYYQRELRITAANQTKAYDGTPLTSPAGLDGLTEVPELAAGHSLTSVEFTGSQTDVGSSNTIPKNAVIEGAASNYYLITYVPGSLTVTAIEVVINVNADRWNDGPVYDGTERTIGFRTREDGLEISNSLYETAHGDSIWNMIKDISRTETDAGFYTIPAADIRAAITLPDDPNFIVTLNIRDGELTIKPAPLTITTGSGEKEYDGTALTVEETGIEGLVNNETATVTATGAQVEVGESSNTYKIEWGTAKEGNYVITDELGTLTVTNHTSEVILTAASDSKTYDGSALENSGVTASGLPDDFTIEATASGSATNVGDEGKNEVQDGYKILDQAGNDKTEFFTNVTKVDGTLTINPAPATVKTGSDSKAYDGTALTKDEASIEGLVNNETAAVTATGSQTEVGSSDNTYSIDWGTTNKDNYTITENLGTLTVTESDAEVVLTAASDGKTYDGSPLENSGVTASGLPDGFTVEAAASGSATNVGDEGKNVVNDGYVIKDAAGNDKTKNFTNVEKVDGKLTINPAAVTVVTGSDSKAYDGTALTKDEASITGLVNGEDAVVSVSATGSQTEVGSSDNTYSIAWGTAKAENYTITDNLGTLTVTKNSNEITLTAADDEKVYDGTALENSEVTAHGLPDGFTIEASASGSQTDVGSSSNVVNDGYVIKNAAGEDRTENFTNVKKDDGTLKVTPAPVTIKTGSDSKAYNGTPLTKDEASIEGLVNNETAAVTATGSQTEVGSSDNTYSIDWGTTDKDNYQITEELGTLEVTVNDTPVMLTAASDSKTYDGLPLSKNELAENGISGLPEGFTVEAAVDGSQTNVGTGVNEITGYIIKNAGGEDKTENFTNVDTQTGSLTVTKASVTIKTGSDSKAYDGTALTNDEASIEGLVNNETAVVTATGSQTEVGSSDNTYSIDWGTTIKGNYEITENLGTLTVTKSDAQVVLTAASDSKYYDGTPLTNSGVTASGLPDGFTIEATASGSATNVGDAGTNVVNDGFVIKDADENDKTANFTKVEKVDGKLTINPVAVTVTTGSASKQYDGTALTNDEASITGLVNNEDQIVTVTATGSLTEPGESPNTYEINWGSAAAGNYTITEVLGTLTVTDNSKEITLKAASASKDYDGTPLTDSTVTATGLPEGFTIEATASGSATNVGDAGINVVDDGYKILNGAGKDMTKHFTNVKKEDGTLTINPAPLDVTTSSDKKVYDGTALTNDTASVKGLVNNETATATATGSLTDVGQTFNTYTISWGTADQNNYTIRNEYLGLLEIIARMTDVLADDKTVEYNGQKQYGNTEYTFTNLADMHTGTITYIPSEGTAPGTYDNGEYKYETLEILDSSGNDVTGNYILKDQKTGKLTIENCTKEVRISSSDGEWVYDGKDHTNHSYTVTFGGEPVDPDSEDGLEFTLPTGDKITILPDDTAVVRDVTTKPVSNSFTYTLENEDRYDNVGTEFKDLSVTRRIVILTSATDEKEYDGEPLKNDTITEGEDGFAEGEGADYDVTGSQLTVGSSENEFTYTLKEGTKPENYSIELAFGTLTVISRGAKYQITVEANSGTFDYDGSEHTVEGFKTLEFVVEGHDYTVSGLTAKASRKEAGEYPVNITGTPVVKDSSGNDVSTEFAVSTKNGKLKINPKAVTVTAENKKKVYDGDPSSDPELTAKVEGLVGGDNIKLIYTLSRAAGQDVGQYAITAEGQKTQGSYTVTYVPGVFEITKSGNIDVIPEPDDQAEEMDPDSGNITVMYDGRAHTVRANASTKDGGVPIEDAQITYSTDGGATWSAKAPSRTHVGEITYSIKASHINYEDVVKDGFKLTVTRRPITLTAADKAWTYDGEPHTDQGVEVTAGSLAQGDSLNAKAAGSVSQVSDTAEGNNPVDDSYAVMRGEKNVTKNYEVTTVAGTLTINPKAVTVTADNKKKVYDGDESTDPALTAAEKGLVEKEDFKLEYSISREAGQDVGSYVITPEGGEAQGNYIVTYRTGIFEITKSGENDVEPEPGDGDEKLDAESKSITVVYDGKSHTVSAKATAEGSTIEYQTEGGSWSTTAPSRTDVGTTTFSIRATHENYEDVVKTGYKLIVEPRQIKVTTGSADKVYDGTALTSDTVDVEVEGLKTSWVSGILSIFAKKSVKNLVEGESITVETTGSQTEIGSSANTVSIEWDKAKESNYTIVEELGTLTVTAEPGTAHMTVKKVTTSKTPEGGYPAGATIDYKVTVTNDGDLTITDIVVTDELTGDEWTVASLASGESKDFTAVYTVTEADVLAGEVVNVATAKGTSTDPDHPEVPAQDGTDTEKTEKPQGHLTVEKVTTSKTPKSGYSAGDKIEYKITVINDGNLTITDITVTDKLTGDEWTLKSLAPGKSKDFTAQYTVTEADVAAGEVVNVATARGTSPDPDQPDVPVEEGIDPEPTAEGKGHLTVNKVTTSKAPEGGYPVGATIEYKITVINDGDYTITDITVTDKLTGDGWTLKSLAPGESKDFKAKYTVTEADVAAGEVVNVATARGTSPDPNQPDVPVEEGIDPEPTAEGKGHLTVNKVTTSKAPEGGYPVGATIEYKITVINDGDYTITDITVTDKLTGDEWTLKSLAPGESKDFTAKYTVTEADAEAGEVVNVATAKGTSPDPDHPEVPAEDGTDTEPVAPVKPEPATYDIRYKLNGGTYEGSKADIIEKYPEGTVIGIHEAPEREGYTFDYWKGSAYQPGDKYTVTGDHVFTAQWKKVEAEDDDDADDDHHKTTKKHSSGSSPRTGDDSNTALWLVILLLAAAGATGTAIYRRKNRK